MEARTGSMTIAALLGTGLATLGFAVSGVSALGDDLQAARTAAPAASTPVLSPSEESRKTAPSQAEPAAPSTTAADELRLQQACDRRQDAGRKRDGRSPQPSDDAAGAKPAVATAGDAPQAPATSVTSPAKEY